MGASPLVLTCESEPSTEILDAIGEGLNDYNALFWARQTWREQALVGRDAAGLLQSGGVFIIALEWMFVHLLWVAEPYRRSGEGSRLLNAMEAEARAAGCCGAYLDTFSFQAPKFYAKHGYSEFGRIADFPRGHARIWLMKRF